MTGLLLLAVLAAGDGDEARRDEARLHAALGVVVTAGSTGYSVGLGPGINAELGVVLGDHSVLSARLNLGTVFIVSAGTLGVAWDYAFDDHWSVGLGAALGFIGAMVSPDLPFALTAQLPVRAQYAFSERAPAQVARRSLVVFVEISPGVTLAGSAGFRMPAPGTPDPTAQRFAGLAVLGLSWAWF